VGIKSARPKGKAPPPVTERRVTMSLYPGALQLQQKQNRSSYAAAAVRPTSSIQHATRMASARPSGVHPKEDFLSRLGAAEERDTMYTGAKDLMGPTASPVNAQKHLAYQRSQREPVWTKTCDQPVGGRFNRAYKFNQGEQPWTAREEQAFQAAFGKPSDRKIMVSQRDAPTGF